MIAMTFMFVAGFILGAATILELQSRARRRK